MKYYIIGPTLGCKVEVSAGVATVPRRRILGPYYSEMEMRSALVPLLERNKANGTAFEIVEMDEAAEIHPTVGGL